MPEKITINIELTKDEFECLIEALAKFKTHPSTPMKQVLEVQQIYNKLIDSSFK